MRQIVRTMKTIRDIERSEKCIYLISCVVDAYKVVRLKLEKPRSIRLANIIKIEWSTATNLGTNFYSHEHARSFLTRVTDIFLYLDIRPSQSLIYTFNKSINISSVECNIRSINILNQSFFINLYSIFLTLHSSLLFRTIKIRPLKSM